MRVDEILCRAARRVWRAPLAAHAATLLTVLVLANAYVGSRSSFIPDEGGLIIQDRMLARGQGWIEHPPLLQKIDPSGAWYPLDNAEATGAGGFAPLAKHPVYSLMASGLYRMGGVWLILASSVLGGWAAALVAAAIGRRFDPRLAVPTLWAAGVASPLFFDSFLALAHTVGAALCGGAVLSMLRRAQPREQRAARSPGLPGASSGGVVFTLLVGLCLFLAALVRNEAVIFGIALGVLSLVFAVRQHRLALVEGGVAAFVGLYLARQVEREMRARILGGGSVRAIALPTTRHAQTFVAARASGFFHTWLEPSHLPAAGGDALVLALWALIPFLVVATIKRSTDTGLVLVLTCAGITVAFARLLVHPYVAVPGLLMAFPLLWAAGWTLRPRAIAGPPMFCLLVVSLYFTGVLLTQYPQGGALEWGGRYFALGLPVLVPVALLACSRASCGISGTSRTVVIAAAMSISITFALFAVVSLHDEKSDNRRLVMEIDRVSRGLGSRPVVISVVPWLGRLSWSIYDKTEMLYVPPEDLGTAARRLRDEGVRDVTFVSFTDTDYATFMTGWTRISTENFTAKARYWTVDRLTAPSNCCTIVSSGGSADR